MFKLPEYFKIKITDFDNRDSLVLFLRNRLSIEVSTFEAETEYGFLVYRKTAEPLTFEEFNDIGEAIVISEHDIFKVVSLGESLYLPDNKIKALDSGGVDFKGREGITLREYFAGQALSGILANPETERYYREAEEKSLDVVKIWEKIICKSSRDMADKMMEVMTEKAESLESAEGILRRILRYFEGYRAADFKMSNAVELSIAMIKDYFRNNGGGDK